MTWKHWFGSPPSGTKSSAKFDLLVCTGFVLGAFVLAGATDLHERFHAWSTARESWELDEILIAFAMATVAFAWYALRRWREARHETLRRIEINRRLEAEIAARKDSEHTLRESEDRLRLAARLAKVRAWSWNSDNRLTHYHSLRADLRETCGRLTSEAPVSEDELLQDIHPEDREQVKKLWDWAYAEHLPYEILYRIVLPNGETCHNHEIATPEFDDTGRYLGHFGVTQNVTDRTRAEEARKESEERLRQASEIASIGYYVWNSIEDRCTFCSEQHARLHGMTPEEYIARASALEGPFELTHPDDRETLRAGLKRLRAGERMDLEYRIVTPQGTTRYVREIAEPVLDAQGRVIQQIGTTQDITEMKRSETLLKRALDASSAYCALFDANDRLVVCNQKYRETNETPAVAIEPGVPLERIVRAFAAHVGVGKTEAEAEAWIAKRLGRRDSPAQSYEYQRIDGEWIEVSDTILEDGSIFTIGLIVTERKRMERALRQREAYLRAFLEHSTSNISIRDAEGKYVVVNRGETEPYGLSPESAIGKTPHEVFPTDIADRIVADDDVVRRTGEARREEFMVDTPTGQQAYATVHFPIYDPEGEFLGLGGVAMDISDLKTAETQLRQAQKMEALGKLTGGVAHDFNNMLAAIIGNLEIMGDYLEGDAPKRSWDIAFKAALGAADLTDRLLTFARQEQVEHSVLDLRATILEMRALLRTTLGESIQLETRLPADMRAIKADPVQLQNAMINLAANARDAMPNGGTLTVEAANADFDESHIAQYPDVAVGAYVVVSVSDTGHGMPEAVRARVFDPFFTTKEVGKGTGLGLSTIFGFMKQLGGHIAIDSEEGQGTTVRLYLPAADSGAAERGHSTAHGKVLPRGSETILVVDDDAEVRETTSALLSNLGYQVVLAEDGPSALARLDQSQAVDLLLTDTVMPGGMSGYDLAYEAVNRFPNLRVLRTSGRSGSVPAGDVKPDPGIEWIPKPYLQQALAEKIRKVLDQPPMNGAANGHASDAN